MTMIDLTLSSERSNSPSPIFIEQFRYTLFFPYSLSLYAMFEFL